MTLSNSFMNFGIVWVNTLITYSLNYINLRFLFVIGTIYSVMLYKNIREKVVKLDSIPEEKFEIS